LPISVQIRRNVIPALRGSIVDRTEKVVRDEAHFMRDYAQSIAPVRTGAFRASLYVNGPNDESDYAGHASQALQHNPKARIVPEIHAAALDLGTKRLRDELGRFSLPQAIVAPAVEYGLYLEEGTVHMAPRPTLRPAALVTQERFKADMSDVADGF
jgi:hypothetical protein